MAERKGHLQINLLETSFVIEADEQNEYLQAIYNHYAKVVAEVEKTTKLHDPLKIAIIAGILLADEITKEHLSPNEASFFLKEMTAIEQSTQKMIDAIDSVICSDSQSPAQP